MWPHSISIVVGGKGISVGTDAPEVIAELDPWRIDDIGDPIDYCLELHPPASSPGKPRRLPGLYHGSTALLRNRDSARVATALLRVLASHARPAADGQLRLRLMPLVRDGIALLAPPASIAPVPDRWMLAQGIEAFHTVSSLVDAQSGAVLVDAPLGTDEKPATCVFGGWWLPSRHWDGALSPGFAVAEAMTLVSDVTVDNAASTLRSVAALVERAHPVFAPRSVDAVKERLPTALDEVPA